ncbi:lysozyme g-like [Leptodactylus fuscus]|uniref:lysozyme g-like n=1 Tax=Leptodactylus fuscus TaxID=238119 RepID=UPI003F4F35E2
MKFYIVLILSVFTGNVVASGNYGDIGKIHTKGASCRTAQQDRLPCTGVEASKKMAANDLSRINKYKPIFQSVARSTGMDAAVIAAIASRESRGGSALKDGWGDNHNAYGIMQVDQRYHKIEKPWNGIKHVTQATNILISMWNSIRKKFPSASKEMWLKGAIAAYNCGPGNVKNLQNADTYTTGKDYSDDVVARALHYRTLGY